MKCLIILTLLCFTWGVSLAQRLDKTDGGHFSINGISINAPTREVLNKFGQPSVKKKHADINGDGYWFDYVYDRNALQVSADGRLIGFDIKDSSFVLKTDAGSFKVGDGADKLCGAFRQSCAVYKQVKGTIFRVAYKDADAYLAFEIKAGVIKRIYIIDEL